VRVVPLEPDVPRVSPARTQGDANAFTVTLDAIANALQRADAAETAFASGTGTLQSAVLERARADVTLAVASAAAQRTATAVQSVINLQI